MHPECIPVQTGEVKIACVSYLQWKQTNLPKNMGMLPVVLLLSNRICIFLFQEVWITGPYVWVYVQSSHIILRLADGLVRNPFVMLCPADSCQCGGHVSPWPLSTHDPSSPTAACRLTLPDASICFFLFPPSYSPQTLLRVHTMFNCLKGIVHPKI